MSDRPKSRYRVVATVEVEAEDFAEALSLAHDAIEDGDPSVRWTIEAVAK